MATWLALQAIVPASRAEDKPAPPPATNGVITATLKPEEPVKKVWAIHRNKTSLGIKSVPHAGKIDGNKITFENLPVPGQYDLRIETESGLVEGWNWRVPRSDYEEEQPLADESRAIILKKMAADGISGFANTVTILDFQGNIEYAAVLSLHVRQTGFATSFGDVDDETVWYVRRDAFENPEEHTWAVSFETPYYNLWRERIKKTKWGSQAIAFARHVGGIQLDAKSPKAELGTIVIPKVGPGIRAVNPDGSPIAPLQIKPALKKAEPPPAATNKAGEPQAKSGDDKKKPEEVKKAEETPKPADAKKPVDAKTPDPKAP